MRLIEAGFKQPAEISKRVERRYLTRGRKTGNYPDPAPKNLISSMAWASLKLAMETIATAIVAKGALPKRMTMEKINCEQIARSIIASQMPIEPFELEKPHGFLKSLVNMVAVYSRLWPSGDSAGPDSAARP